MRKLLFMAAAVLLLVAQGAMAAGPEFRSNRPEHYTVKKGDTLWDIASRFLKNPWYWPEIWHANPQIQNPDLIYPGDELSLVYINGKPMIEKTNGSEPLVKLSPKIRSTHIETPVPTIPLADISGFLSDTRVVNQDSLKGHPYVLEGRGGHIASGAGDVVYARGKASNHEVMGIYRRGKEYFDPITHEFLGLEAKSIGRGEVTAINGDVLTFNVTRSNQEVLPGDRLLPTQDRNIMPTFKPSAPNKPIHGYMIDVLNGVAQIGQFDVVAINKGSRDGLKEGNVLAIYQSGGTTQDPYTHETIKLPAVRSGLLMVFRTFKKVSYGLVLEATRSLSLMDEVRNP